MDEGLHIEKRASLLMMNFSVNEVDFALDKLGMFMVSKKIYFGRLSLQLMLLCTS